MIDKFTTFYNRDGVVRTTRQLYFYYTSTYSLADSVCA